ncbi:hypothetical protein ACVR77_004695, partial [Vibrio parahaemolyticus]
IVFKEESMINEDKIWSSKFNARLNKIYYSKLSHRFHMIQTVNLFFSILFSTTAFTAVTNIIPLEMRTIVAISSVSCLSVLNVFIAVFSISDKAKRFESSKVEWMIIERRILDLELDDTESIDKIIKEVELMQISEEHVNDKLVDYAYKRACVELGVRA